MLEARSTQLCHFRSLECLMQVRRHSKIYISPMDGTISRLLRRARFRLICALPAGQLAGLFLGDGQSGSWFCNDYCCYYCYHRMAITIGQMQRLVHPRESTETGSGFRVSA